MVLAPETRPKVALRRPQCWEFLVCDEGLLGPGAAIADLLGALNLLAATRGVKSPLITWQWTLPSGRAARGCQGQAPRVPRAPRVGRPDVLVVPGWQARNGPHLNRLVERDAMACDRLRAVHAAGGHVIAFYNGVALVGEAGLLAGGRAVVPWPFVASVLRHEPTLDLVAGESVVEHRRVWSADSPALATEVALAVLNAGRPGDLGDLAESVRSVLLHAPERQRLVRALEAEARQRVGPGSLERARRWLEEHLHEPYSLSATAHAAAVSERSLLRHFQARYGVTPLQMLHGLRVMRARMLLESSYLSTEAIAEKCGWRDSAMFREVFRRFTGTTPAAYRARFSLRAPRQEWGRELSRG
jgi:transcriptional regulator GlxA family with amidase domain